VPVSAIFPRAKMQQKTSRVSFLPARGCQTTGRGEPSQHTNTQTTVSQFNLLCQNRLAMVQTALKTPAGSLHELITPLLKTACKTWLSQWLGTDKFLKTPPTKNRRTRNH